MSYKKQNQRALIMSAEKWLTEDLDITKTEIIFGRKGRALVTARTKNFIEAKEKSFKTTFLMRLLMGLAAGITVFEQLPVNRRYKVLYLHGELNLSEIKERTQAAWSGLPPDIDFIEGKDLTLSLVTDEGKKALRDLVAEIKPEVLALDPWQSFISTADENSGKEMSAVQRFLDELIMDFGLTIIIPIHVGKTVGRGARGHSSLGGWRDTKIELTRKGKTGLSVFVDPRCGAPMEPFMLQFSADTLVPSEAAAFSPLTNEIVTVLRQMKGRATRRELAEAMGRSNSDAFRKALERAEEQGAICLPDRTYVELATDDGMDLAISDDSDNGQPDTPKERGVCPSVVMDNPQVLGQSSAYASSEGGAYI